MCLRYCTTSNSFRSHSWLATGGFGRFQPSGRAPVALRGYAAARNSFGGTLKTLQAYRPSERFSGWLAIEGVLVDFGPLTGLKTGPSCKQTNTVVRTVQRPPQRTNKHKALLCCGRAIHCSLVSTGLSCLKASLRQSCSAHGAIAGSDWVDFHRPLL